MTLLHLQMLFDLATPLALLPILLSRMSKRGEWNSVSMYWFSWSMEGYFSGTVNRLMKCRLMFEAEPVIHATLL
jgi:hypothetical protein